MGEPTTTVAAEKTAKLSGWLKTVIGAFAGLLSGAVMMYLSPLLDKVVKPAKPVANFAVDHQGLTVSFYNRSTGGGEGWWDFGDGSPLEPLVPRQEVLSHTYAAPGNYTAKLTLRNLLGEESERTVSVSLESPRTERPVILSLDAIPVSPGAYAPATFRVVSKSRNAQLCVWDLGEDRPLEINADLPNSQERMVTFPKPGGYVIKLAAVNGNQAVERSEIVYVNEPPEGTVAVILTVTDQATQVEAQEMPVTVTEAFPPQQKENVYSFDRQVPARQGYEITAARLESGGDSGVRNLQVQVAADRRSVHVTGQLVRPSGGLLRKGVPPNLVARIVVSQERRTRVEPRTVPVTASVAAPGSALLSLPPLPEHWVDVQRQLHLEIRDNDRIIWQESQLPRGANLTLGQRHCTLNALVLGSQVRVDLTDIKPILSSRAE